MKVIIVGCGKVGRNIAESLQQEGHDIVLIDKDEKIVGQVSGALDVLGVIGNGASYETLTSAGIEDTDVLLAVTDADELNLLCCLFAKKMGNCKTIARVRNPIYYDEVRHIREELGLAMIINPEMAAAKEVASIIRFPSAINVDSFERERVDLLSFVVAEDSILVGKKIMDVVPNTGAQVLIAGIEREGEAIIPNGYTVFNKNDKVTISATFEEANKFFEAIKLERAKIKNCLMIGGSRIAYYLAKMLIKSGIKVTIIEQDEKRCDEIKANIPQVNVIVGDGSSEQLLDEEGLRDAESFVALTDIDETNVILSMYAKKNSHAKVITKVNRISYDSLLNDLDVGSIIYPKHITADNIIQFVRAMDNNSENEIETLYHILNGKAEALSFRIKKESTVTNQALEKLDIKENLLICAIIRNRKLIIPTGKDEIKVGDAVIVVTTNKGISDISGILK